MTHSRYTKRQGIQYKARNELIRDGSQVMIAA